MNPATLRNWVEDAERSEGVRSPPRGGSSRRRYGRCGGRMRSYVVLMRSCAPRVRFSLRRSSTADSSDRRVHRPLPRSLRRRADLCRAVRARRSDRAVHLLRAQGVPGQPRGAGRGVPGEHPGHSPPGELGRVWGAEAVARRPPRGPGRGPGPDRPADADRRDPRGRAGPAHHPDHMAGSAGAAASGPGATGLARPNPPGRAVGGRLLLRVDPDRVRVRRVHSRRVLPPDPGLARLDQQADTAGHRRAAPGSNHPQDRRIPLGGQPD